MATIAPPRIPIDDFMDYLTGHYRHLHGIAYAELPHMKHGPIERKPAENQIADYARRETGR